MQSTCLLNRQVRIMQIPTYQRTAGKNFQLPDNSQEAQRVLSYLEKTKGLLEAFALFVALSGVLAFFM